MKNSKILQRAQFTGLIDRRSSIERSFLWQRKYQGVAIRISLRTKISEQALNRYAQISSAFIKLKQLNSSALIMKMNLTSLRDKLVDNTLLDSLQQLSGVIVNSQAKTTTMSASMPLISEVAQEWVSEMERDWAPKTKKLNENRVTHFIKWIKDVPIGDITKKDISEYKHHLDESFKSTQTRQSTLSTVSSVFNFAMDKREYISKNPIKGMLYRNVETMNKKESISKADHLKAIERVKDGELKWLMQILWNTGLRIGEAVQLRTSDYIEVDGIPCISINSDDGKTLKNQSSTRDIPIHRDLIDLGILDVKPTFHWTTAGSAADRVRLAFKAIGIKRTSHCYRYSVSDRLRDLEDIPDHVRYSILGHAHETMTDRVYRNKQPTALMKKAIDSI